MVRLRNTWVPAVVLALWGGCSAPRDQGGSAGVSGQRPQPPRDPGAAGEVEIASVRDGAIIRGRTAAPTVRPGTEREEFLARAARVLEVDIRELDITAPITTRYGADEMQVYECILHAEDVWRVELIPPRIPVANFAEALAPFATLQKIMAAAESAPRKSGTGSAPGLEAFMIQMSVDSAPTLYLVLSADGAVNRGGSGNASSREPDVFIAQTDGAMFREVAPLFNPQWLERPGMYRRTGPPAPRHVLTLTFIRAAEQPVVLGFDYGPGDGPPPDVHAFVQRALAVTQSWYEDQREIVRRWDAAGNPPTS